jgi:hypothetical protein
MKLLRKKTALDKRGNNKIAEAVEEYANYLQPEPFGSHRTTLNRLQMDLQYYANNMTNCRLQRK